MVGFEGEYNYKGGKKYRLAIQSVFLARENILFLKEWLVYHKELGVDHFYLYDNTGSIGRNGSNKELNKYGIPFADITRGMSDEDIQNIKKELLEEFPGEITYVQWTPRNKMGQIVYNWANAFRDFVKNYGIEVEWTAFIDMDEFLFSVKGKNLKDIIKEYENESVGYLSLKQKRFEDRFYNLDKYVIQIDRCVDRVDYARPKNIVRMDMIDEAQLFDKTKNWAQHCFPFRKGKIVHIDKEELRFNHYNTNEKQLEKLKGLFHTSDDVYLNSQDDSMKRYWNIIESKCGKNRPIDILSRYPSTE